MKTKYKISIAKMIYFFLKFFFKKEKIRKINGIFWSINLSEGIDLNLFILRNYEPEILNCANKLTFKNKKRNIIDIGANIGAHTLKFANKFNNKIIHAIEPTNYCFSKLKKNISLNPILKNNIKLYQNFIKLKHLSVPKKIYSSWKLDSDNLKHPEHLGLKKSTLGTKSFTLDNFIKINKITDICFIKLDVDGHEYSVLKSGTSVLKKRTPIIMELAPYLYPEFNYTHHELIKLIKKYNYNFYTLDPIIKINDIKKFVNSIKKGSSINILIK